MPSAIEVKGLRIRTESAGDTLHAQCVLSQIPTILS
jgi:hypothetical protein